MDVLSPVGSVLTLLGTFAGVWVVVLLFRWLQSDFVDQYRKELEELRKDVAAAVKELDVERAARRHAEDRAAHYRYELFRHGIPVPDTEGNPPNVTD